MTAGVLAELQERLPWLLPAYAFAVGAVVGSFLNVVIARVPAGQSVVRPRSRCPRCETPIAWFDNLPIISWIALRARCRSCGLPISARYPVVELLVGLLAVAVFRRFGVAPAALGFFVFAAALVALAYIDLDTWLLPHEINLPLFALGLASPAWNPGLTFVQSALGAAVGTAVFAGVALFGERVLKRETMGWGDVWLLGGIGAWLGIQALLPVVLLSSLQGAIVGLVLIAVGRDPSRRGQSEARPADAVESAEPSPAESSPLAPAAAGAPAAESHRGEEDWVPPRHAVPFGPFLALAALQMLLVGDALLRAWDGLIGWTLR